MTVALGVDTASEAKKRGYAIADCGRVVWCGKRVEAAPRLLMATVDVVAGEEPWQGGVLRGKRLITFCVNNGFQLRDAWTPSADGGTYGEPIFVILPVKAWKELAIPGCSQMPGDQFCNNLREKYALGDVDDDVADAAGIAVAASMLPLAALRAKYQPKGFRK